MTRRIPKPHYSFRNPISVYHMISFMNIHPASNAASVVMMSPKIRLMHFFPGYTTNGFFKYPYMDDMKV